MSLSSNKEAISGSFAIAFTVLATLSACLIYTNARIDKQDQRLSTLEAHPDTVYLVSSNEDERVKWTNHYSRLKGVDSALALQISRAENFRAIPDAWSRSGCCVGDFQVHVRYHYGKYASECDGSDLLTHRDNACYGVALIRDKLKLCKGSIECMLARYGGATNDSTRLAYLEHVEKYGSAF